LKDSRDNTRTWESRSTEWTRKTSRWRRRWTLTTWTSNNNIMPLSNSRRSSSPMVPITDRNRQQHLELQGGLITAWVCWTVQDRWFLQRFQWPASSSPQTCSTEQSPDISNSSQAIVQVSMVDTKTLLGKSKELIARERGTRCLPMHMSTDLTQHRSSLITQSWEAVRALTLKLSNRRQPQKWRTLTQQLHSFLKIYRIKHSMLTEWLIVLGSPTQAESQF